jgi:hypothetical protein
MPFEDLLAFVATSQMPFVEFVGICCHKKLLTTQFKILIKICSDIRNGDDCGMFCKNKERKRERKNETELIIVSWNVSYYGYVFVLSVDTENRANFRIARDRQLSLYCRYYSLQKNCMVLARARKNSLHNAIRKSNLRIVG